MANHLAQISSSRRITRDDSPPLENGEHLNQPEFHRRYERMPEDVTAELIGGIDFMAPRQKRAHGKIKLLMTRWLDEYEVATPGVEAFVNTTVILGPQCEPQPDTCLLIVREHIGQTKEVDEYIVGAPEWTGEISPTTSHIDLHRKKADYEAMGVKNIWSSF